MQVGKRHIKSWRALSLKPSYLAEEQVQTFMQMGLTRVQAKVYLSLFYMRQGTIRGISQKSEVSRQDIYQALKTLETTGLAEKIISTPICYRPVPIKEGISILLQRRNEELKDLQRKTGEMFQDVTNNSTINLSSAQENEFVLIPSKNCLHRDCKGCIIRSRLEKAEKKIDHIMPLETFKGYLPVSDNWDKSLERGAKIRFLINNPEKENPRLEIGFLREKGSVELRFTHEQALVALGLIDNKEVLLKTNMEIDAPTLISRNPCLINTLQQYFEFLWNRASKN
jgi:sugar-specific transcriptional regulator TrmB